MIELGQRFCFKYEALFCLHAWLQERRQELDGHFLIELCIFGEINLTHASYTKLSLDCVAASEGPANHRVSLISAKEVEVFFHGRQLHKGLGLFLKANQGFNFSTQVRIVRAEFFQSSGLLVATDINNLLQQFIDLLPAFRRHFCVPTLKAEFTLDSNQKIFDWRLMALSNQSLALLHSRVTVAVDIPRASAISFSFIPPKYFITTTSLLRGSSAARSFRASSSATRSGACFGGTSVASSR